MYVVAWWWLVGLFAYTTYKFSSIKRLNERSHEKKDADDKERKEMVTQLESAIVAVAPNVRWSDVAGLETAKQALSETAEVKSGTEPTSQFLKT